MGQLVPFETRYSSGFSFWGEENCLHLYLAKTMRFDTVLADYRIQRGPDRNPGL